MLTAVTAVCSDRRITSWEAPLLTNVGKDLCRVAMQPSPRPVFIKEGQFEHLYIPTGNSTRRLTTKEAIEYAKNHWKGM